MNHIQGEVQFTCQIMLFILHHAPFLYVLLSSTRRGLNRGYGKPGGSKTTHVSVSVHLFLADLTAKTNKTELVLQKKETKKKTSKRQEISEAIQPILFKVIRDLKNNNKVL